MKHQACHEDIISSLPFRIYAVQIDDSIEYLISIFKSKEDFQHDVSEFYSQCKNKPPEVITTAAKDFFEQEGYIRVYDLVSAWYNGRLVVTSSRVVENTALFE